MTFFCVNYCYQLLFVVDSQDSAMKKGNVGRKPAAVNNLFRPTSDGKAVCAFCGWKTAGGATRKSEHIAKVFVFLFLNLYKTEYR